MNKIRTNDQIELAYRDVGEGDFIILIHGLDGNLAAFNDLQDELKVSYRVISYDLRGHGKSSKTDTYELTDHIDDLKILMDELNIHEAHILGHDLGGVIAKEYTERFPWRVKSLTMITAKLEDLVHTFMKLLIDYQDEVAGFNKFEAFILLFSKLFQNEARTMKWYQDQRLYCTRTEDDSAAATRSILQSKNNLTKIIKPNTVPTLVINGKFDPLITDKWQSNLDDHFVNIQKEIFSHSGHAPHIEEPEVFLECYLNFIKEI